MNIFEFLGVVLLIVGLKGEEIIVFNSWIYYVCAMLGVIFCVVLGEEKKDKGASKRQ